MLQKDLKKICEVFASIIKNNPIRPITDLVEIFTKDGVIYFGSTDNITIIKAKEEDTKSNIDRAVISLSRLQKLVKLTTVEEVILTQKDNYVEFKGNGKYKLPIQVDESGGSIILPLVYPAVECERGIKIEDVQKAYNRSKIAITSDYNELNVIYITEDSIVATNSIVVAKTKMEGKLGLEMIKPYALQQLSSLPADMKVGLKGNNICAISDKFLVYIQNYPEQFPIDGVKPFLVSPSANEMYKTRFKVSKKVLIDAIKRQDLFKGLFDVPVVSLAAGEKLTISNNQQTSYEEIDIEKTSPCKIEVVTERLLGILKNMQDEIEIFLNSSSMGLEDEYGHYILAARGK